MEISLRGDCSPGLQFIFKKCKHHILVLLLTAGIIHLDQSPGPEPPPLTCLTCVPAALHLAVQLEWRGTAWFPCFIIFLSVSRLSKSVLGDRDFL